MQDLNKIWTSCVDTLEKQNIVEDKIMLDSLFRPATLEAIEDNKVTITTDLQWNIDPILEKQSEIESILSNSFSKPITINVLSKEEYNKKKLKQKKVPKIDSHLHPDMTFSNFIVVIQTVWHKMRLYLFPQILERTSIHYFYIVILD